ncbi:putative drug exporter of the RND superfamily [Nonomuraea jiangxiensis]|uniref:Putative drug exporter of the RND superfamily n=1 Tax=Nonomuraea jiangxiensis TaxID=633440 RepID=A0A1G9CH99_9ACTN|nr:putative drug exporter of the RND superfamily [Nonomuraea jiangxiensis]
MLSLAATVLAAPLVAGPPSGPVAGGFEDPRTDSATAARWTEAWYGGAADVVVLYRHPTVKVRDPRYRRAVHDSLRRLPGAYVRGTVTYWTGGAGEMVSRDGRSTYALVTLRGGPEAKRAGYAAIEERLRDAGNLRVSVGGPVPLAADFDGRLAGDLTRAVAVAAPVLLVLLVLVSGSLVAAVLPLVVGALAVLGALAWLRPGAGVSWYVVVMLGLVLAVDHSLFVLRVFRAELRAGAGSEQAVVRTVATAGRTVACAGLAVTAGLLVLALFPQPFLRSTGLGAAAAASSATLAALVVLPALLGILGRRVNALRLLPGPGRRWDGGGRQSEGLPGEGLPGEGRSGGGRSGGGWPAEGRPSGGRRGGGWHGVAASVTRRSVSHAVVVILVLLVLGFPLTRVTFGSPDHRALPATAESRQVAEAVDRDFAPAALSPIDVHVLVVRSFATRPATPGPLGQGHVPISAVTRVTAADVRPLKARLEQLPQVTGVRVTGVSQAGGAVRLAVRHEAAADAAPALVRLIRSMPPEPDVRRVVVGGPAAEQVDARDSLLAGLPWLALMVSLAVGALLLAAGGSLLLAVKGLLVTVLSLGASCGALTWAAQDGPLSPYLGPTGAIDPAVPVLIVVVVFALSTNHEFFLVSRARTEWSRTGDAAGAVAAGLRLPAPALLRLLGPMAWRHPRKPSPQASAGEETGDPPDAPPRVAASADRWPVVFGVDTDPVQVAEAGEPGEDVEAGRVGWVKVGEGRARVVRPGAGGRGWVWMEVDE